MRAVVTYPYRDKDTGEVRYAGEAVELTSQRYAELSSKGYVGAAAPADTGTAETATAPDPEPKPEPAADDMTAAQLRAAIEAKGGFAPKKATKAQLASILETL